MDLQPKPSIITGSWQIENIPALDGSIRKHIKVFIIAAPSGRSPAVIGSADIDIPAADVGMALAEVIVQAIKNMGSPPLVVSARLVPNGNGF